MKSIGFAFDNFNFIVYPLKFSGMDGVIEVVDDPVTVSVQHFNKSVYRSYFEGASQIAPLIDSLNCMPRRSRIDAPGADWIKRQSRSAVYCVSGQRVRWQSAMLS